MEQKLGLKEGAVILKKHHSGWKLKFLEEKDNLHKVLRNIALDIQHFGSTAIPNLLAKPIIDIIVSVRDISEVEKVKKDLKMAGYEFHKGKPNKKKLLLFKGSKEMRTFHIHIVETDNPIWRHNIVFRDYLLSNPKAVHEYEKIKIELARKYPNDRDSYFDEKSKYIEKIIARLI